MEVPTRIEQVLTPRVRFSLSEEEDVDLKLKYDKGLRSYARSLGFSSKTPLGLPEPESREAKAYDIGDDDEDEDEDEAGDGQDAKKSKDKDEPGPVQLTKDSESYGQQKIADVIAKWERRLALEGRWAEDYEDADYDGASSVAQSSVASTGSPGNRSFGGADLDASNLPEPGEDAAPASGGEPSSKPRRGPKPNTEEWYENDDGFVMEEDERPDIAYMLKQLLLKGSSVVAYADRLVDFEAQEGGSEEGALHGSALASDAGAYAESPSKKKRGRPAGSKDKAKRRSKKDKEREKQGGDGDAPARSGSVGHLVPYWDDEDTPISRIRDEIARLRGGGAPTNAAGVPLGQGRDQGGGSGGVGESLTAPAGGATAASNSSSSSSSSSTGGGMEGTAENGLGIGASQMPMEYVGNSPEEQLRGKAAPKKRKKKKKAKRLAPTLLTSADTSAGAASGAGGGNGAQEQAQGSNGEGSPSAGMKRARSEAGDGTIEGFGILDDDTEQGGQNAMEDGDGDGAGADSDVEVVHKSSSKSSSSGGSRGQSAPPAKKRRKGSTSSASSDSQAKKMPAPSSGAGPSSSSSSSSSSSGGSGRGGGSRSKGTSPKASDSPKRALGAPGVTCLPDDCLAFAVAAAVSQAAPAGSDPIKVIWDTVRSIPVFLTALTGRLSSPPEETEGSDVVLAQQSDIATIQQMLGYIQSERGAVGYPPILELPADQSTWVQQGTADAQRLEAVTRTRSQPELASDRATHEEWHYRLDFVVGPCTEWARNAGMDIQMDVDKGGSSGLPPPRSQTAAWLSFVMLFGCHCSPLQSVRHVTRSLLGHEAHSSIDAAAKLEEGLLSAIAQLPDKSVLQLPLKQRDHSAIPPATAGAIARVYVCWQQAASSGAAYRKQLSLADRKALAPIYCAKCLPGQPSQLFALDIVRGLGFSDGGGAIVGGSGNAAAVKAVLMGLRPSGYVQRVVLEQLAQRLATGIGGGVNPADVIHCATALKQSAGRAGGDGRGSASGGGSS